MFECTDGAEYSMTFLKKVKKKLILCIAVLGIMLLTGCTSGSTVDTVLKINPDGSGHREMTVTVEDMVMDKALDMSEGQLKAFVEENIPEQLNYKTESKMGKQRLVFTLEFASAKDYAKKISEILGRDTALQVDASDSIWLNGIYVEEDFDSKMLLDWLKQALIDVEVVAPDQAYLVFQNGQTSVEYSGEVYQTTPFIYVNDVNSVDIDAIDILTAANGFGRYDRTYIIRVPKYSMDKNGDTITSFFKGVAGKKISYEKIDGEDNTAFILSMEGLNPGGLQNFGEALFGTGCYLVEDKLSDSDRQSGIGCEIDECPYSFGDVFAEKIWAKDASLAKATLHEFGYYFGKSDQEYSCVVNGGSSEREALESDRLEEYDYLLEQYKDYDLLREDDISMGDIYYDTTMVKVYAISQIDVQTTLSLTGKNYERESVLLFQKSPSKEELKTIVARLQSRVEEEADTAYGKNKISYSSKDNLSRISIIQKGDSAQLKESSIALFGTADTTELARKKGIFRIFNKEEYKEELLYLNIRPTEDFKLYYRCKKPLFTQLEKDGVYQPVYEGEKLVYQVTNNNNGFLYYYEGKHLNLLSIGIYLLVLLIAVGVLILVLKIKKRNRIQNEIVVDMTFPQPTIAKIPEDSVTLSIPAIEVKEDKEVCPQCKESIDAGTKFCKTCGYRLIR